ALHRTDRLFLTFPFVLYGLFRYLQVVYSKGGGGDPTWEMLRSPHLIAAAAGWLGATGWFLAGCDAGPVFVIGTACGHNLARPQREGRDDGPARGLLTEACHM